MSKSLEHEKKVFELMVKIYCEGNKHENSLCKECQSLIDYGLMRIDNCPFKEEKSFCSQCKVHCFENSKREEVRKVMRYSGPRMIFHHPIMALMHALKM